MGNWFKEIEVFSLFYPSLALPHMQQAFEVNTDAIQHATGATLKQGRHPIAYHFKILLEAKFNYSTYDKEFHPLIRALNNGTLLDWQRNHLTR